MPHCVAARARIHYEVDGEGEPLVLIAGTAFDLSFWDDLLPELRGFRVLRLDNRGAGLSDAPDEAFSIEQMADDVAAVMDAAGMPSAHVYGMSMGGLIAQDLAIRYPERVLSLVLGAGVHQQVARHHHSFETDPLRQVGQAAVDAIDRLNK